MHLSIDSRDNDHIQKYATAQLETGKLDLDVHLSVLTPFSIITTPAIFQLATVTEINIPLHFF